MASNILLPGQKHKLTCDSMCFGFTEPNHGVNYHMIKDPYYYRHKCLDDRSNYIPYNYPVGYGMSRNPDFFKVSSKGQHYKLYDEPDRNYGFNGVKNYETFDFSWNTVDRTPINCMYLTNGGVVCYKK